MAASIEVRIGGRGRVKDGAATDDASERAVCDLCGAEGDAVASTSSEGGGPFACKACLRVRLEAMTVGSYLLKGPESRLPWGKVSG
ncbi:MAG: hypothetical protein IPM79_35750 [Polyangiaceae bacterium]|jgi:hypothetical protein|nr:hypothetical protein [Polyangiaceae bacterium]MBK8942814.1 hypothetical protein [Polyangiaceae bacterium]